MKKSLNKVTSLKTAVADYLHDGDSVAFSGMGGQQCMATAREIVRQGRKELTLIGDSPTDTADTLIGAGLVKRLEVAYISCAVVGLALNYRRAAEQGTPRPIEIAELSNYTMGLRFLAGAMNLPFMPTRSLLGSDLPKYSGNVKFMNDPFKGEPLALVPAAHPDVAFIHAQRADALGNTQFLGWSANAENMARAAKYTVITCEEIVSTDEIRAHPNRTVIPQFCVDAVVHCPYGSHPWNMPYCYVYDIPFHMEIMKAFATRDGFLKWIDEWVYGCKDHEEYCQKVGWERLHELSRVERKFSSIR